MDVKKHYEKFIEIIKKYNLDSEQKANEIADYLQKNKILSLEEFSKDFVIPLDEAKIFLDFIKKGLEFKKNTNSAL